MDCPAEERACLCPPEEIFLPTQGVRRLSTGSIFHSAPLGGAKLNLSSVAYNALLHSVGLGIFPYLRSKSRHDPVFWMGRRGHYLAKVPGNPPRVWFHASSVGEMTGAVPTIVALAERLPEASVTVTAGTPQGFRYALSKSPPHVRVLPFPLDFPGILKRAFDTLQPDLYAGFEGEFWPNLYHSLARARVPALLLNGRLSRLRCRSTASHLMPEPISSFPTFTPMKSIYGRAVKGSGVAR